MNEKTESHDSGQNASTDWHAHVAALKDHADGLLLISNQIFEEKIEYTREDRSALMLLGFASRQDGHLRAIRVLVDSGHDADATLIARTMAEGIAQLTWALDSRPDRPEMWFWYGLIEDWRQVRENAKDGQEVDIESSRVLDAKLKEIGPRYLHPKVRKRLENGEPLPDDPYRRQWSDLDLRSTMAEVGLKWLYDTVYRTYSDRVHWTARSLFLSVEFQNGAASGYRQTDPQSAANALKVGFFSLYRTLILLDWYFELGRGDELSGLHTKFEFEANRTASNESLTGV